MQNFGAHWNDGWTPIRDAVVGKARKYGDLDVPLVVAVNVRSHSLGAIDEMQALFGQERFVFDRDNLDAEPGMERASNGAWMGRTGPRARRCSGAWLFHDVTPYTVSRRKHTLYANPWSHLPLPDPLLMSVPRVQVVDNRIQRTDGEVMGAVLGLAEQWPE